MNDKVISSSRFLLLLAAVFAVCIGHTGRDTTAYILGDRSNAYFIDGLEASVTIDCSADNVLFPIDKKNFGGKIDKHNFYREVVQYLSCMSQLAPGFWIYTMNAGGSENQPTVYRWDTHSTLPGSKEENDRFFSPGKNFTLSTRDGYNAIDIDYWSATDGRHSACVIKNQGAPRCLMGFQFRADNGRIHRSDLHYMRFDFRINSDVWFSVPQDNKWILCTATDSNGMGVEHYSVWLDGDDRLNVKFNLDSGGPIEITSNDTINFDEWYTVQVRYDLNNSNATVGLYVNGQVQGAGLVAGLDTGIAHDEFSQLNLGAADGTGTNVNGKINIDALRFDDEYIGTWLGEEIGPLSVYPEGSDFDKNAITVDDFLQAAEIAGIEPVIHVPMFPADDPFDRDDWATPQWSADLVEYILGTADPDYEVLAAQLDYDHETPSDNWANLRAARGRVGPYNAAYFILSTEPYWVEGFADTYEEGDPHEYAKMAADHIQAMKADFEDIKVGVHSSPSDYWRYGIYEHPDGPKDLLDFVCAQHDYAYDSDALYIDQIPWILGCAWAANTTTGSPRGSGINRHLEERERINTCLSHRADYLQIPTIMDEHGYYSYVKSNAPGDDLAHAIFRMSYKMETIDKAGQYAWDGDWQTLTPSPFKYGIIGGGDQTPAFWAYKMFFDHFRDGCLEISEENLSVPAYTYSHINHNIDYEIPYISIYASRSSYDGTISIMIINRHETETIPVNVTLQNNARNLCIPYKIGGSGFVYNDNNQDDRDNVIMVKGNGFSFLPFNPIGFQVQPLSINLYVIRNFHERENTKPTLSVDYGPDGVSYYWTNIADAESYGFYWGEEMDPPYRGTSYLPDGYINTGLLRSLENLRLKVNNYAWIRCRAFLPDNTVGKYSVQKFVVVMDAPTNYEITYNQQEGKWYASWDAVPGATGYILHWGTSSDPNDWVDEGDVGNVTSGEIYPPPGVIFSAISAYYDTNPEIGTVESYYSEMEETDFGQ